MDTKGAKLSGDAKMLIPFFGLFYSPKKAMSRKSRRGFWLTISFHKGLVAWGGLWRSSQEGPLKLLTLLKSACAGKNNESRACLFKRPPAFPLMQSQEEPTISGSPRGHEPQAAQLMVQGSPLPTPMVSFPNSKILTGFCSLG